MSGARDSASTVPQLLALRVAETPQAVAFQRESGAGRWEPVTWQEFGQRVATLRRGLVAAGLRQGDRLALVAPVSLEWELLHHAAMAIGAVVVGLDAHDLPERIAAMAAQAGIVAFATADARVLSELGPEHLARVHFVLQLGPSAAGSAALPASVRGLTWAELDALPGMSVADPAPPGAEDGATIIFTSGSSGAPKGILFSHGQLCLAVDAIADAFGFVGHEGRLLCWLPLSNLFQRVVNLAAVRQGVGTWLLGDPRRVMQVVASVSPDVFIGVPRFYEKLYDGIRDQIAGLPPLRRKLAQWGWAQGRRASPYLRQGRPLPPWLALAHGAAERLVLRRIRGVMGQRLRCMITGSAPAPVHLLEEFHALGWLVLEAYGMSENVLPMAMNRIDAYRFGTVGRPVPGNEIVVAADGAIRVRGPGVFGGYLGGTDRPPFDAEGYYLTGDLGELDGDGYLRLTGRSGDMIKTSTGRRVAPAAVEEQLRSVPGIDQALLIGNGRKALVALCTCAPDLDDAARASLKLALQERVAQLGAHERPAGIALIARPFSVEFGELTPNLKLRRAAIEERHATLIAEIYEQMDVPAGSQASSLRVI